MLSNTASKACFPGAAVLMVDVQRCACVLVRLVFARLNASAKLAPGQGAQLLRHLLVVGPMHEGAILCGVAHFIGMHVQFQGLQVRSVMV